MNFSNTTRSICILGGTGFVGRHLISRLAQHHFSITVLSRHPERHRDLGVIPKLKLIGANCYELKTLHKHFKSADAVINLIGILNEKGDSGKGFHKAHVELVETIVQACDDCEVPQLLHMSALNADAKQGPSYYLQTKGEGEETVKAAASDNLSVTVFQPSVIFGPGDKFFNRFAQLIRKTPGPIPLACPKSLLAPVYIGDVVDAIYKCIKDREWQNNTWTLCGPTEYTLKQLVKFTAAACGHKKLVLGMGKLFSKIQARVLEMLPGQLMSRDNYRSLQVNSTCKENGLIALGIEPHSIESVVPRYLNSIDSRSKYNKYRRNYTL